MPVTVSEKSAANEMEHYLLELVNNSRAEAGLKPLQLELTLNSAAEQHSQWMLDSNTFDHTGEGGSSHADRMKSAGFNFDGRWSAGENIATSGERGASGHRDDVEGIHKMLMDSPGHRANIMNPDFEYVGIGIEVGDFKYETGGSYKSLMVTQNFAATDGEVHLDSGNATQPEPKPEPGTPQPVEPKPVEPTPEQPAPEKPEPKPAPEKPEPKPEPGKPEPVEPKPVEPAPEKPEPKPAPEKPEPKPEPGKPEPVEPKPVEPAPEKPEPKPEEPSDAITGTDGDDRLIGTSGDDHIKGLDGNDYLNGGKGADVLDGGEGIDLVSYWNSNAAVVVNLDKNTASGGHAEGDSFQGIEHMVGSAFGDYITGNDSDNGLLGFTGNDYLDGGKGADKLDGGMGLDIAAYANSDAAVNINLAEGTTSGGDAEGDVLVSIESLMGSDFDDTLTGDDEQNVLMGGKGKDTLTAGAGDDVMIGGTGADKFVFNGNDGGDIIVDFEAGVDKIAFGIEGMSYDDLEITDAWIGTLITYGEDESIFLTGLGADHLSESDFTF